jgi:hypothetical protein
MSGRVGRAGARTDATATGQRRAREWREMLGLGFRALGLDVQTRPGRFRSETAVSDFEAPALADFVVTSTTAERGVIGMALDEVEGLARAAGRRWGVVVQKRREASPERAFVTMSVRTFTALVQERADLQQTNGRTLRALASTPPGHR